MPAGGVIRHAVLTADAIGGVWRYACDLAAGLAGAGVRATIAVLGPAPNPSQTDAARAGGADVVATGLPLDWTSPDPQTTRQAAVRLAEIAEQLRADVLHVHAPALGVAPGPVPCVATIHSCLASWWRVLRSEPMPADFEWNADLNAEGFARLAAVAAPTRAFSRLLTQVYGLAHPPEVVHNGSSAPTVAPSPVPGGFVFMAGRLWDEGKNAGVLDLAARSLTLPVRAAGCLRAPHGAIRHFDHVELLGELPANAVWTELLRRPIFVAPSRYEPFGLAVLEAARAGCPLVLSDIPTFRELWDGTALFFRPDDPDELASRIRLLENPATADRLGRAAQWRSRLYTIEAMTESTLSFYARACGLQRRDAAA